MWTGQFKREVSNSSESIFNELVRAKFIGVSGKALSSATCAQAFSADSRMLRDTDSTVATDTVGQRPAGQLKDCEAKIPGRLRGRELTDQPASKRFTFAP